MCLQSQFQGDRGRRIRSSMRSCLKSNSRDQSKSVAGGSGWTDFTGIRNKLSSRAVGKGLCVCTRMCMHVWAHACRSHRSTLGAIPPAPAILLTK